MRLDTGRVEGLRINGKEYTVTSTEGISLTGGNERSDVSRILQGNAAVQIVPGKGKLSGKLIQVNQSELVGLRIPQYEEHVTLVNMPDGHVSGRLIWNVWKGLRYTHRYAWNKLYLVVEIKYLGLQPGQGMTLIQGSKHLHGNDFFTIQELLREIKKWEGIRA